MVNFVARHIGIVPGTLAHCANAGENTRGHFCGNTHFATIVINTHHIAIGNTTLLRIQWVNPDFLATGRFQHVDVAVA
ncbi:hypothetical protein D3C73_1277620 [compost metagenome]